MKKIISILLVIVFCFSFASCKKAAEIERKPIDKKFTAEHTETVVLFNTVFTGKSFVITPIIVDKQVPDTYEILYLITYDDGKQKEKWETVTEAEYSEVSNNDA